MSSHQRTSWIGAILVYFGIMVLTWLVVRHAYCVTPQIANFRAFAEPTSTRMDSKTAYLYGPLALQVILFGIVVLGFRETITRKRKYILLFCGFGLLLLCAATLQSYRALHAAHLSGSIWFTTIWNGCPSSQT